MVINGVALLAVCSLLGLLLGELIGAWMGVKANVGGVGFAMILLVWSTGWLQARGRFRPVSQSGLQFWSGFYLPIIVAMAAQQNVVAAVKGGPVALMAGVLGVVGSFALIPWLDRLGRPADNPPAAAEERR